MNTTSLAMLCVGLLIAVPVHAQCENESAALATATALQKELAGLQETQQTSLKEVQKALDSKATELAWTERQRAAFLTEVTQTAQYAFFELEKQEQVLRVGAAQEELRRPAVKNDPIAACNAGQKMASTMRKIGEVSAKQFQYLLERIQAAK